MGVAPCQGPDDERGGGGGGVPPSCCAPGDFMRCTGLAPAVPCTGAHGWRAQPLAALRGLSNLGHPSTLAYYGKRRPSCNSAATIQLQLGKEAFSCWQFDQCHHAMNAGPSGLPHVLPAMIIFPVAASLALLNLCWRA